MATKVETLHTCLSKGAFGQYDPACPRCQELMVEKAVGQDSTATVTITRPQRPDFPVAERPVQVKEQEYQTGSVRKLVEPQPDGSNLITYQYRGRSYAGCLSFERPRYNGQGFIVGSEVFYILYPTKDERDAAKAAREEQRAQQEATRRALRAAQAQGNADLIGPNGLPIGNTGAAFLGGLAPMPPMR